MDPQTIQTPEKMLERWQGAECTCDPSVGHLCERCHDIQVVRNLIKERHELVDVLRDLLPFSETPDAAIKQALALLRKYEQRVTYFSTYKHVAQEYARHQQ